MMEREYVYVSLRKEKVHTLDQHWYRSSNLIYLADTHKHAHIHNSVKIFEHMPCTQSHTNISGMVKIKIKKTHPNVPVTIATIKLVIHRNGWNCDQKPYIHVCMASGNIYSFNNLSVLYMQNSVFTSVLW